MNTNSLNPKISKARSDEIAKYKEHCIKKYGHLAMEHLNNVLGYFIDNPSENIFVLELETANKELLDAIKLLSVKDEFRIFVKPALFSRGKKIKFYSEWPYYEDMFGNQIPVSYEIVHNKLKSLIRIKE